MNEEAHFKGWVKVYRLVMEKAWYKDSRAVHLWFHLLLKANHKEGREVMFGGKVIKLKRGQFISGRHALAEETGIEVSKVVRTLELFKSEHQIEQQASNKNSLFTIVSWDEYQNFEQQNEQQMNNSQTTDEQQTNSKRTQTRIKKGKNVKNEENVSNAQSADTQVGSFNDVFFNTCFDGLKEAWLNFYKNRVGNNSPRFTEVDRKNLRSIFDEIKKELEQSKIELNPDNVTNAFLWILDAGTSKRFTSKNPNLGAYNHALSEIIDVQSGRMRSHMVKQFLGPDLCEKIKQEGSTLRQRMEEEQARRNDLAAKPKDPLPDYMNPCKPAYFSAMMDKDVERYYPDRYEEHMARKKSRSTLNRNGYMSGNVDYSEPI